MNHFPEMYSTPWLPRNPLLQEDTVLSTKSQHELHQPTRHRLGSPPAKVEMINRHSGKAQHISLSERAMSTPLRCDVEKKCTKSSIKMGTRELSVLMMRQENV